MDISVYSAVTICNNNNRRKCLNWYSRFDTQGRSISIELQTHDHAHSGACKLFCAEQTTHCPFHSFFYSLFPEVSITPLWSSAAFSIGAHRPCVCVSMATNSSCTTLLRAWTTMCNTKQTHLHKLLSIVPPLISHFLSFNGLIVKIPRVEGEHFRLSQGLWKPIITLLSQAKPACHVLYQSWPVGAG